MLNKGIILIKCNTILIYEANINWNFNIQNAINAENRTKYVQIFTKKYFLHLTDLKNLSVLSFF